MKKLGDTALKWSILVLVLRRVACWHCRHGIRFLHRSKMYLLSRAGSVPRAAGWLGVLKRFSISIFGVFRKRTISRTGRCQLEESGKREIVGARRPRRHEHGLAFFRSFRFPVHVSLSFSHQYNCNKRNHVQVCHHCLDRCRRRRLRPRPAGCLLHRPPRGLVV